uniref:Uncharacterized protein n=1 Tax=Globodera rostochiensis TaxID=31243 RepID=A0A914GXK5_GLORO
MSGADESPSPFGGSKIGTLEVTECRLLRAPGNALLNDVEVMERLSVSGTQWPCSKDYCGTEGLLLAPNSHRNLHWQFTSNRCFEEREEKEENMTPPATLSLPSHSSSSLCDSSPSSSSEFVCRRTGPLEECMCRPVGPASPSHRRYVHLPSSSALLFLIGDCPEHSLVLHSSALPFVQSLYVFRVAQLVISSVPPSLRHLNILHSAVSISNPNAFSGVHLFELAVDESHLEGLVPEGTLHRGQIERVRLEGVDNGWRQLIRELAEVEGGSPEGMAQTRRRGVPQKRTKNEEEEQWAEGNGQRRPRTLSKRWTMVGMMTMMICWKII